MNTTLRQYADFLGVHPYDLTGDKELADDLMNEDITDTIFYKEMEEIRLAEEKADCIKSGQHFKHWIAEGGYDVCMNCGGKD